MKLCSNNPVIECVERAQPWLGTRVSIRVEGLEPAQAHRAIDAAFEEVATVHRLMSFHEHSSDVGQLNRHGASRPVAVHPYTLEVLEWAQIFAARSNGCFDVSVGAELVDWQLLPRPSTATHTPQGSWRDIELRHDGQVQFHRPLWIDLGGIAKGYAVDRATECLRSWGAANTVVNAGGDIRVTGQHVEQIALDCEARADTLPVVELTGGSIASSSGHQQRRVYRGQLRGPHVDGARRSPSPTDRFVCVLAERCIVADALTKVVMAQGRNSAPLLIQFGASAHLHDPLAGWQHIEAETEAG